MSDSEEGIPFLTGSDFDSRTNVAWRVELGRPDSANPLIEPEMPWDSGHPILHGTVLRDPVDGLWKAWGTAVPGDGLVMQERRLAYFESDDGRDWRRPELDFHRYGSHERTNILLDLDSGGNSSYASVLVVPDAPEPRRYQMFLLRRPGEPERLEGIGVVKGFRGTDGSEPRAWGVYRYCSGDGLRWEPDVGPVLVNDPDALRSDGTSDSVFIHRGADGSFAAYHKSPIVGFPGSVIPYELGAGACRVLVHRTSEDGIDWNRHEPCMMPDWRDPGDTQSMEMSVTPAAGGWIGIVTVYRAASQTLELQFAASRDGRHWWRPDRRPCLSLPPVGDYGGGMMWGTHHMVADGADWHYYYGALQGIHGDMLSTEEAEFAARHGRAYRPMPASIRGEFEPVTGPVVVPRRTVPRHVAEEQALGAHDRFGRQPGGTGPDPSGITRGRGAGHQRFHPRGWRGAGRARRRRWKCGSLIRTR